MLVKVDFHGKCLKLRTLPIKDHTARFAQSTYESQRQ